MPANSLNSIALPSITGSDACGPMLPSPSTAVPSVTIADRVALDRELVDLGRVLLDGRAHAGHARRVRHRQVVTRRQRNLRLDLDLAADVHQERAVADVPHRHAVDGFDRVANLARRGPRRRRKRLRLRRCGPPRSRRCRARRCCRRPRRSRSPVAPDAPGALGNSTRMRTEYEALGVATHRNYWATSAVQQIRTARHLCQTNRDPESRFV